MIVGVEGAGKKYGKSWVFKDLSFTLQSGDRFAILGSNGSGKSTLLKVLAGFESPSRGKITWSEKLPFPAFSFTSPYIHLYEDLQVNEFFDFHQQLAQHPLTLEELLQKCWLSDFGNHPISALSSGMRQRLKLGISLWGNEPVILLDEPSTNLDKKGKQWFQTSLAELGPERTVIIATNEPEVDINPGFKSIEIEQYKKAQF